LSDFTPWMSFRLTVQDSQYIEPAGGQAEASVKRVKLFVQRCARDEEVQDPLDYGVFKRSLLQTPLQSNTHELSIAKQNMCYNTFMLNTQLAQTSPAFRYMDPHRKYLERAAA